MNLNLELILHKNPNDWSSEEVQIVCQSFIEACENEREPPDRLLTTKLWRYWFLVKGEEPIMNDPKYNMALMLNAQTFGDCVPPSGDNDFFGRYRQQHQKFEEPLIPPRLIWGPRACMNKVSGPTVDSAIVHVFVFKQSNGEIYEILVVGRGIPEIEKEIFDSAFSCILRTKAGHLDMINGDVYRILASNNNQELFDIPGITRSGIDFNLDQSDESNVLNEFVRTLKLLQDKSGLVFVHDQCDASVKQRLDSELREYARQSANDNSSAIIVAKDPDTSPEMADLVTLLPYYHIKKGRPLPLRIKLDPAILDIPSFQKLLEAFTYQTVERISLDAKVRLETYEKRRKSLEKEKERWDQADERTRKILWDEYVILTEKFDFETGRIIKLSKPKEISMAVYMKENVPLLIENYNEWEKRMHKIIEDIERARERPDKPILRLAASHFLDAALRGCDNFMADKDIHNLRSKNEINEGSSLKRGIQGGSQREESVISDIDICFQKWSNQVAPFLRWRWRTILEAKGIDPEIVFRRNTVFHTHFQIDDDHNVFALVMQPLAMVSPIHSVVVFDAENPIIMVKDPSDYAQEFTPNTNSNVDELWQNLQRSLKKVNQKEFISKLREALAEEPVGLLTYIVNYLTSPPNINLNQDNTLSPKQSFFQKIERLIRLLNIDIKNIKEEIKNLRFKSTESSSKFDNVQESQLDNLLLKKAQIIEQIRLAALPSTIITFLNQGAFHSARQLIQETQVSDEFKVHMMLWQVLVECLAHKKPPSFISNLRNGIVSINEDWIFEVEQLLRNSENLNFQLVHQWIELLENSLNEQKAIESAINFLQRNWIRFEDNFLISEQQALYSAQSAIDLIFLARTLDEKAQDINSYSESSATVLAKIDQVLEELLISETPGVAHSDILSLLEILLGEKMS